MALNIVKYDASFKMADSLSPTIRKVFNGSQMTNNLYRWRERLMSKKWKEG